MSYQPRSEPQTILVPVDFSAHSEAALLWACDLASLAGARLLVLHVVHDPAAAPGYYHHAAATGDLVTLEESARKLFDRFLSAVRARRPDARLLDDIDAIYATGLPATRILEVAEREGATHIVMGSHGRTGLKLLLLGSKAERVVRLSPVPITIVKVATDAAEGTISE